MGGAYADLTTTRSYGTAAWTSTTMYYCKACYFIYYLLCSSALLQCNYVLPSTM